MNKQTAFELWKSLDTLSQDDYEKSQTLAYNKKDW